MSRLIDIVLSFPYVFDLQQRLCNNYTPVKEAFQDYLDKDGSQKVLDIGCSTAACAVQIINFDRNDYTGIDISDHYIDLAKKKKLKGKFLCMDARQMDFDNEYFDVAMLVGVLHHMNDSDVRACLKEVLRVLKPGGVLLISEAVFTQDLLLSNILISLDRGRNVRSAAEHKPFFEGFRILKEEFRKFICHRVVIFALQKV